MADRKDIQLVLQFRDDGTATVKKVTTSVAKQLESVKNAAKCLGKDFKTMSDQVKASIAVKDKFKNALKSTWAQMAMGMGIMTGITGAIRMVKKAITSVITTGRDFEREWANVTTMILDSSVNAEAMKNQLIGLSPVLGNTTELAKGMYQVLSASIEPAKAIMFLGEAAKSAQAGVTNVFTAVDALTTVINAYGMATEKVTKVSDVMFMTVMRGKLTYEGMAGTLGTVVPVAAQVGVSFEEVAAAMATLTRRGVDVNTTTVQLRQIMVAALKPTSEATKEAAKLGLEFNSQALAAKGLSGFLKDVEEKTGGNVDSMTQLFGNVRALSGVFGLAGKASADFAYDLELTRKAMEEGGQTEIAFRKQMQSLDFWIKTIMNVLDKLKISIWQGFAEPLRKGISTSADFEKKIEDLSAKAIKFGQNLGKAIGDVVMFLVRFGKVLETVTKIAILFFTVKKIQTWSATFNQAMVTASAKATMFGGSMTGMGKGAVAMSKGLGVVGAALAGWQIGRAIGQVTGLDKAIQNFLVKTGPDNVENLKSQSDAMAKLKEAVAGTGASVVQLKIKYGSWEAALKAVQNAQEPVITQQKSANEEAQDYMKTLEELGLKMRTDVVVEWMKYNQVLSDANLEQNFTKKQIETMAKQFVALSDDLGKKVSPRMRELAKDSVKVANAFKQAVPSMSEVEVNFKALDSAIKDYIGKGGRADELTKIFKDDIMDLWKQAEIASKVFGTPVPEGLKKMIEGLDQAVPKARDMSDILKTVPSEAQMAAAAAELLGVQLQTKLIKDVKQTEQAFTNLYDEGKLGPVQVVKAVQGLIGKFEEAGIKVPRAYRKILKENQKLVAEVTRGSGEMSKRFMEAADQMGSIMQILADEIGGDFGKLVSLSGIAFGQISQQFNSLKAQGMSTGEAIATAIGPQLAGQIGATLGGVISGAKKNFGALGSTIGGTMGSIFGPVGKVIGSAFGGLIGGLFKKGETEAEKAARKAEQLAKQIEAQTEEAKKSMSVFGKISDATAKAIAESRKEMGGFEAESKHFAEVIKDVGVNQKNVNGLWKRASDIMDGYRRGLLSASDASKAAGESFMELVKGAEKIGTTGSKAMVEFIKRVRASGLEVAEVTDYINNQLGVVKAGTMSAAQGLEAMAKRTASGFDALKERHADLVEKLSDVDEGTEAYNQLKAEIGNVETQMKQLGASSINEMARLERQTLATFNAMIENNATYSEAMESLGPVLDIIRERHDAMGTKGSAAIQELLRIREVVAANTDLFNAVDGNLAVLNALANTGSLTQEVLMDSATATSDYYKQLVEAGMSGNQALTKIAPTLERLRFLSQEHGLAIDDATQKLIKQAEEQKLLDEQQLSTQDTMLAGFGLIIEALGKEIPDAMKKSIAKMHDLEQSMHGSGVYSALQDVQRQSDVTFTSMDVHVTKLVGGIGGIQGAIGSAGVSVMGMGDRFKLAISQMNEGLAGASRGIGELEDQIRRGDFSIKTAIETITTGVGAGTKTESAQGGYDDIIREPVKPFVAHRGERVTVTKASDVRKGRGDMGTVESLLEQLITAVRESGNVELVPTLVPVGQHLDSWLIKASPRLSKAGALKVHPKGVRE